jgi:hypothetical protein
MTSAVSDPVMVALTGIWPVIMMASALLTFPASAVLLWFYRRAVLRAMNQSREGLPVATTAANVDAPPKRLRFASLGVNAAPPATLPSPWGGAVVYLAAGAAYAFIVAAALAFLATRDRQFEPTKVGMFFLWTFWIYYWPAMLAVILVAGEDSARKIWVVLGYFAVFVALTIVGFGGSPNSIWSKAARVWINQNGPATVLLYLFLRRRIRSVGPLVLFFANIALLGFVLAVFFLGGSESRLRAAVEIGDAVGIGGNGIVVATLLLDLLLFAVLGWLVLRWIGARYSAKKFSDESLTLDAIFMLFGISASQDLAAAAKHWTWIATGLVAFIAYKVAVRIGFRFLPKTPSQKRLLLLRVFALGKRSESLFDAMRRAWLRGGVIAMIAGPDLVTSAVEPHEFLGFLSGKLGRTFVGDDADLGRRVGAMDLGPDPDGRYRVAEFFCRADTWQPTMRRLVADSDAVLMDLRSFSASNQGCVYELGRLLDEIDLGRIVFVTDKTTDHSFLEATLQQQWSSVAAESPNRFAGDPAARFFEVHRHTAAETHALVGYLASSESKSWPRMNEQRTKL